jgi:hypothetical protein
MKEMPEESNSFEGVLQKYADHLEDEVLQSHDSKAGILSESSLYVLRERFRGQFERAERLYDAFMSCGIFRPLVADILHRTGERLDQTEILDTLPPGVGARVVRVFPRWLVTRTPDYARLMDDEPIVVFQDFRKESRALRIDFLKDVNSESIEKSLRVLDGPAWRLSVGPSLMSWVPHVAEALFVSTRKILENNAVTEVPTPVNPRLALFNLFEALQEEGSVRKPTASKKQRTKE